MQTTFLYGVLACNLISLFMMAADKRRARQRNRRIPEWALWLCALPFSAPGAYVAMQLFRHKTKKPMFAIGMPVLGMLQFALLLGLLFLMHQKGI